MDLSTSKLYIFLVLFILTIQVGHVWCITCYSCTYTDNISRVGYECVTNPANYSQGPNTVDCSHEGICHMEKVVSTFNNQIDTLVRGCGFRVDGCESDTYEETCTKTCSGQSLCNDWNEDPATTTASTTPSTTIDPNAFVHCYSCEYMNTDDSTACLDSPETQNTVRCNAGDRCYVLNQTNKDTGKIVMSERNCGSYVGSRCEEDAFHEYCYDTCFEDLCNDLISAASVLASSLSVIYLVTFLILFHCFT